MLADAEAGKIGTIICKDMSRFGRDYLNVGMYTEIRFPEMGIRFIAVSDGVDSENDSSNDFTPFRNIINEMLSLRRVGQEAASADSFRKNQRCLRHEVHTSPVLLVCLFIPIRHILHDYGGNCSSLSQMVFRGFVFISDIFSLSQIIQVRQFRDIVFLKGFFPQFCDFGFPGLSILI